MLEIVSGGQTGADRAALDWAIANGLKHGGWCPKGRWAEDGTIPAKYQLTETPATEPAQRTEWNVRDSDGTVIFSLREELTGGSMLTVEKAKALRKPWILIWRGMPEPGAVLRRFVQKHGITRLNVAGPRASEGEGIGAFVRDVLDESADG